MTEQNATAGNQEPAAPPKTPLVDGPAAGDRLLPATQKDAEAAAEKPAAPENPTTAPSAPDKLSGDQGSTARKNDPPTPRDRSKAKFDLSEGVWTVRCHAKCRLRFKDSAVGSDPRKAVELYAKILHLKVDTAELKTGKKDQAPREVVSVRGKLSNGSQFNAPAVITNPDGERFTLDA